MTKVLKLLGGGWLAAVLGVVLFAASGAEKGSRSVVNRPVFSSSCCWYCPDVAWGEVM